MGSAVHRAMVPGLPARISHEGDEDIPASAEIKMPAAEHKRARRAKDFGASCQQLTRPAEIRLDSRHTKRLV
jgi:hypothetical protein